MTEPKDASPQIVVAKLYEFWCPDHRAYDVVNVAGTQGHLVRL